MISSLLREVKTRMIFCVEQIFKEFLFTTMVRGLMGGAGERGLVGELVKGASTSYE